MTVTHDLSEFFEFEINNFANKQKLDIEKAENDFEKNDQNVIETFSSASLFNVLKDFENFVRDMAQPIEKVFYHEPKARGGHISLSVCVQLTE